MQQSVQAVDFTSFVFASNGDLKTTSLRIAEAFGKTHAHVLRDIEKTITQVSDIFGKTNFGLSEYNQANNLGIMTSYKMYNLTKDGFIMVVMSYTGAKAFAIKEAYINAFNLMHAKLLPKRNALVDLPPSTISTEMQRHIQEMVKAQHRRTGIHWQTIYDQFKTHFEIPRYDELPITKYAEACLWFGCKTQYDLPRYMLIDVRELENLQSNQLSNCILPPEPQVFPDNYHQFIDIVNKMEDASYRIFKKDILVSLHEMLSKMI